MSATLTWFNSGLGTKTGTAIGNLFTDLKNLIDSKNGDSNFSWTVASSSLAGTPYYICLKPKSGAAGRILLIAWSSAPAGNNSAILEATPTSNAVQICYFPAGNVDTPSNLTAASGTIMGDDTGVIKCCTGGAAATVYTTSVQPYYFDSAEAVVFGFQSPGSATNHVFGAGALLVDGSDNAYAAAFIFTAGQNFSSSTSPALAWQTSDITAGSGSTSVIRTNYGSADRLYFQAWAPTGQWLNTPVGPNDILSDTANNKVWFVPYQLLGTTKGEGFVLKLRQIAHGPGTTAAFTAYSTTGPAVQARQLCAVTTGGLGHPWFTNFKL